MPRAWRSVSSMSCGLVWSGSPGSSPRCMPSSPAATIAPNARYGLADPSTALISTFVLASTRPLNVDGIRTAASRLSTPQHVYAELHMFGASREYEFTLGQVTASSAGRCVSMPATKARPNVDRPADADASYMALRLPFHKLMWTWQPLPATSANGFGANDAV